MAWDCLVHRFRLAAAGRASRSAAGGYSRCAVGSQGTADFAAITWFAVFLPRGAPAPIVQKLHGAVLAAMETPSVQVRLKEIGADMVAAERRSPHYLQRFLKSEIEKWAAAIKAANIKVE